MARSKPSRRQPSEPPLRLLIGATAVGMIVGALIAPSQGHSGLSITLPSEIATMMDAITER